MIMGVYTSVAAVEVVSNSESESFEWRGEPSASVALLCRWEDRASVITDLLSGPRVHPVYDFLYAKSVKATPWSGVYNGVSGQILSYPTALLEVSYARKPDGTFSEQLSMESTMLSLPRQKFRWQDGSLLAEGEEPSRQMQMIKVCHSYDFLENIPSWTKTYVGYVNSDTVRMLDGTSCAQETLLMLPPSMTIQYDYTGTTGWQLTTNWCYNPQTWNKFWNNITQSFMELRVWNPNGGSTGGTLDNYKMYPSTTFSGKFDWEPSD